MYNLRLAIYRISRITLGKIQIALACSLYFFTNSCYCAQYDLKDIDLQTHQKQYNKLQFVEENSALLKMANNFSSFLKEAGQIVSQFELEEYVGLRLIHRHFNVNENEFMAEKFGIVEQVPSLVTQAYHIDEIDEENFLPASWIFSTCPQEDIQLFESSNDLAVREGGRLLQKSPEFIEEIGNLLIQNQLHSLLSLAILKRESLIAQDGQIYLEVNSLANNQSIIQLSDRHHPSKSLTTSWSFNGPKQQRCVGRHYCQIEYDGKHVGWYEHTDRRWKLHSEKSSSENKILQTPIR